MRYGSRTAFYSIRIVFGTAVFLLLGCGRVVPVADLVLQNGDFFTVCPSRPHAEAVAIRGDRILSVGRNRDIEKFIGEGTQAVDLGGGFGCPGFNDAYVDFLAAGRRATDVDLRDATSIRDVRTAVSHVARELPYGDWVVGFGWDERLFSDEEPPTKRPLDRVAWTVPVFLKRSCGHTAWVNSMALRVAGIDADTPDPPGGLIVRDPRTGEPTGLLKESAMELAAQFLPRLTEEDFDRALSDLLGRIGPSGITSIQASARMDLIGLFERRRDAGELGCRVSLNFPLQPLIAPYMEIRGRLGQGLLRFGYLRAVLDGNIACRTASLSIPYRDSPLLGGIPMMDQEALNRLVYRADREGFRVGLDAVGDEANRMALEAYAMVRRLNGAGDTRHRISHADLLNGEAVHSFGRLRVVASIHPGDMDEVIHSYEARLGRDRCRHAHAWRSIRDGGGVIAFGSRWPFGRLRPVEAICAAVTRRDSTGMPPEGWNPQERLSVEEAIEAYTLGSAFAEHMEREKGSLEPGKLADIVILDRDLLEIPLPEIREARVRMTVLGGRIIYRREE